jgi:hypothetical protein
LYIFFNKSSLLNKSTYELDTTAWVPYTVERLEIKGRLSIIKLKIERKTKDRKLWKKKGNLFARKGADLKV